MLRYANAYKPCRFAFNYFYGARLRFSSHIASLFSSFLTGFFTLDTFTADCVITHLFILLEQHIALTFYHFAITQKNYIVYLI